MSYRTSLNCVIKLSSPVKVRVHLVAFSKLFQKQKFSLFSCFPKKTRWLGIQLLFKVAWVIPAQMNALKYFQDALRKTKGEAESEHSEVDWDTWGCVLLGVGTTKCKFFSFLLYYYYIMHFKYIALYLCLKKTTCIFVHDTSCCPIFLWRSVLIQQNPTQVLWLTGQRAKLRPSISIFSQLGCF